MDAIELYYSRCFQQSWDFIHGFYPNYYAKYLAQLSRVLKYLKAQSEP